VETLLLSSLNAVSKLIYITESLNFKTVKLLKLGVNIIIADTTWHMLSLTLLVWAFESPAL